MSVSLRRHGHADAPALRELLLDIHDDCYAESENREGFDSRERFAQFVDAWSSRPGWDCVIGYDGTEPVGFAYGAPLPTGTPWWSKISGLGPEFTRENGSRTFAVSEVMVRPRWRKTGTAERLHHELLTGRPEARATLFVDSSHPKVAALYESWGYTGVGESQPFADAPLMIAMVRPLHRPA
ncbi:GNAT family N-acetyltransferase [Streptomyces syringium]|uniref:GNAT family N-acetyltransferase n=1 Tax=Streptomyces syringium TaxID=76729 RepID=UPI0033B9F326